MITLFRNQPTTDRPELPALGTDEFRRWVTTLGVRIDAAGTRPYEADLAAMVRVARQHQVAAVSASVLADVRQPAVARARAFARISTALLQLPAHRLAADTAAA
jgi:hypothetical protein